MKDIVKKSFLLGLGAASMTKEQAERIIGQLVKNKAVSSKEGKQMLKKVKTHAKSESLRIARFAQQEANRIMNDFRGVSKVQVSKARKKLKDIDRKLTKRGKKTLREMMR